jgi:hypothetical protein
MEQESKNMHQPGVDRTGPDRFKEENEPKDLREANDNIRKAQGDDATGPVTEGKKGNRPRFDRDR